MFPFCLSLNLTFYFTVGDDLSFLVFFEPTTYTETDFDPATFGVDGDGVDSVFLLTVRKEASDFFFAKKKGAGADGVLGRNTELVGRDVQVFKKGLVTMDNDPGVGERSPVCA